MEISVITVRHIRRFGIISFFMAAIGSPLLVRGQTPPLVDILNNAVQKRAQYLQEFQNLLSVETKTFRIFDTDGDVKKTRVVKSTFIIYRLTKGQDLASEFRNVLEVDGKKMPDAERRAEDFFINILRSNSAAKEAERVRQESVRYDLDYFVDGSTLFQSVALDDDLLPYFEFRLEGKDVFNGSNVYVIKFRQLRYCPFIAVNKRVDRNVDPRVSYNLDLRPNADYRERLTGQLLIDCNTFRIWSEERQMTVQPAEFPSPVVLAQDTFTFQTSDFGILTPRTILHTQYELHEKERTSSKQGTVMFEYEKFTKPDVEVKGLKTADNN
ncbi:MAG: hypothetical protein JO053_01385 [Acidobacteria bacterium]|nr:hypothetical protein [Acidobacteriota bacterium]